MRVPFELKNFQPFSFSVEGTIYIYPNVKHLAERMNLASNTSESVVETPDGKKVWLTLVGDEDQASPHGIQRGWYVTKVLDDKSAAVLVKAFIAITGEC